MSPRELNIYRMCRNRTRLTQEQWAEKIGVSVESVKRYEGGGQLPSNQIVVAMINESGYEPLAVQHLIMSSQALDVLPGIKTDTPLPQAAIRLINRVLSFAECHRDRQLLAIAEDGVVSDDERSVYNDILEELQDIIGAAYQVRYADEGQGAAG